MTKRTSINLDLDLVAEAKEVLGTSGTTETIHRALADIVREAKLRRLVARRFDVDEQTREWLRRPAAVRPVKRSVGTR